MATLLPLIPSQHWIFRVFDFPRSQLTVLAILSLLTGIFYLRFRSGKDLTFLLLLAGVAIYQIRAILPYTPLSQPQVLSVEQADEKKSIRILSVNVCMDNRESEHFIEQAKAIDPDILVLLEPDEQWRQAVTAVTAAYPYRVEAPLDNTYGLLFYSRYPLVHPELKYLIKPGIPSVHTEVVLPGGDHIKLYVLHPEPPSPTESETSTPRDGELMLCGKLAAKDSIPVIVVGDLNDVAWSATTSLFQEVSQLLDPRIGRGFFNTFNAKYPLLRWPLDHVFHSEHFKLIDMQRLPDINSDHFPIYVELALTPEAPAQQEEPQASPEERQEANKKIKAAKAEAKRQPS